MTGPKGGNIIGPMDNSPEPHFCFADRALAFWNFCNDERHQIPHQFPPDVTCLQGCPDEDEEEAIHSGDESDRESIREELQDDDEDEDMASIASSEHQDEYQNLFVDNDYDTYHPSVPSGLVTPTAAHSGLVPSVVTHSGPVAAGLVAPITAGLVAPITAGLVAPIAAHSAFVGPIAAHSGLATPTAGPPLATSGHTYIAPIVPPHLTIQAFNSHLNSMFLEDFHREAFHIRGKSVDSVSYGLLGFLKARRTSPTGTYVPSNPPTSQDLDIYNQDRRFLIVPSFGTIQQLFQMRLIIKASVFNDS